MTGRDSTSPEPAQEVQRLRDRLSVISDVTRRFAEETTSYGRLLESVAERLAEIVRDSCVVFLLDEARDSLMPATMHARDPDVAAQLRESFDGRGMPLAEHPALRRALQTGESLLVPKLAQVTETSSERVRWEQRLGLHSVLVVPLRSNGRSLGLLTLGRFRPDSPAYDEADRELTESLAIHASLALENARLFARAAEARAAMERAEEARLQFIEGSPVPRYVVSIDDLRILEANTAACALYGYTHQELLELNLDDLRHASDRDRVAAVLAAAGDDYTVGLAMHRRKDGSAIYVEGSSQLSTFQGRPARFFVVSDQTKRVQAERARDESEQRLRRTLDSMREGYTIMGRDLRYLFVNRAGAEQTHLPLEQLLGHTPMDLYPGFEGSPIHLALRAAIDENTPQRVENQFQHADGETGYFELNIQPVPEGLVVLSIDQTERRRAEGRRDSLEEQLRQAQKMEAVGRLAGGIAHDFNNVLSVILGYGEDMLTALKAGDPLREDMLEIHAAAVRAAELTKQLLMFSRQQVLDKRVLDLNEVLTGMERMLRRVLGEQLELAISTSADLGHVFADRNSLEQVVMNLAVNARDAMPSGGRLTLETADVLVDEAFARQHLGLELGRYVLLAVTDTGTGMAPETRARIFEPFFSTKELGKGTGLGLSTVLGIVQQSGGGVWVYSEAGHGTTFKVYLPRIDAAVDTRPSGLVLPARGGSETILLVEDEPGVREVARRVLERNGYQVLTADSALEALQLGETHPSEIHLLVSDMIMPKLSGAELAAQLTRKRPQLRVLFMSGYTDRSVATSGALAGGAAFLQKPFTSESLARKVRGVLDESPA